MLEVFHISSWKSNSCDGFVHLMWGSHCPEKDKYVRACEVGSGRGYGPYYVQKLCEMLTREGDFDICGEAGNGRKAIKKAPATAS